jgi:aminopeptidase N
MAYLLSPKNDILVKNSWEFEPIGGYRNVYFKGSLILETLENYLGEEMMKKVMKEYFSRFKFKHPQTQDFIQTVNKVTNQDFNWFFQQCLYNVGSVDYAVSYIKSTPLDKKKRQFETKVKIENLGSLSFPVEVLIELENGKKIVKNLEGKEKWYEIKLITDDKIKYAMVDPERKIVLDTNYLNNSKTAKKDFWGNFVLSSTWFFALENFIQLVFSL